MDVKKFNQFFFFGFYRNFTGPQRTLDIRETSVKNLSPHIEIDEDSHSKYDYSIVLINYR